MGYVSNVQFMSDICQMAAYERAKQSVVDFGYFRISSVIREARLGVSGAVILWKRIVKLIERELHVRLIPVAASFFLGQRRNKAITLFGDNFPERHLATGRRDVVGYVSAGWSDAAPVVEEKAERLHKIGVGFERSAMDVRDRARRGQEASQQPLLLEGDASHQPT